VSAFFAPSFPGVEDHWLFKWSVLTSYRFRWAVCQLDSLELCRSRTHVRKALRDLPVTLYETYDIMLQAIPERDSMVARHVLQWLALSTSESLRPPELTVAVAFIPGENVPYNDEDLIEDPANIQNICGGLITTVERLHGLCGKTGIIFVLARYSAREYLVSEHIAKSFTAFALEEGTSNSYMAQITMQCLLALEVVVTKPWRRPSRADVFYLYSANSWMRLVTIAGMSDDLEKLVVRLLDSDSYTRFMRFDALVHLSHVFIVSNVAIADMNMRDLVAFVSLPLDY
jgi:hypothetical protein